MSHAINNNANEDDSNIVLSALSNDNWEEIEYQKESIMPLNNATDDDLLEMIKDTLNHCKTHSYRARNAIASIISSAQEIVVPDNQNRGMVDDETARSTVNEAMIKIIEKHINSCMPLNDMFMENLNTMTPSKTKISKSSKTRIKLRIEIKKDIMKNSAAAKFSSGDAKINTKNSRK